MKVVNDQHGAPTYARDLAVATLEALAKKLRGTFHAVNSGQCTWYDVARNTLTLAGLDPALVTPVRTEELPRPAQRPAWGVLDTAKLAGEGIKMCPWEEALEIYVKRERPGAKGEGGGVAVPKEQKH